MCGGLAVVQEIGDLFVVDPTNGLGLGDELTGNASVSVSKQPCSNVGSSAYGFVGETTIVAFGGGLTQLCGGSLLGIQGEDGFSKENRIVLVKHILNHILRIDNTRP